MVESQEEHAEKRRSKGECMGTEKLDMLNEQNKHRKYIEA